jgi:hypothetical protein
MNKKLYYLLSLTWGLPITLIGAVVALCLMAKRYKPKRFGWAWCFEIGKGWGGFNLGLVFLCEEGAPDTLKAHEFGHSIQNCMWGVLMPFVVVFPSVIRYWSREWKASHGANLPPYDSIWFEGQATRLGERFFRGVKWK